jgi:hypothetical protein
MICLQALVRLAVLSLLAVLVAGCGASEDEAATTTPAPTTTAELSEGNPVPLALAQTYTPSSVATSLTGGFRDGRHVHDHVRR